MLVKTAVSPGRFISFFFISPSRCVADKSELVLRWNKNRGGIKWSGSGLPRSHSHLMSWNGRDGGKMAAVAGDKTATTSAPPNQTIRRRSINRLRLSTEKVRVAQKKKKRNETKPIQTGRLHRAALLSTHLIRSAAHASTSTSAVKDTPGPIFLPHSDRKIRKIFLDSFLRNGPALWLLIVQAVPCPPAHDALFHWLFTCVDIYFYNLRVA